MKREPVDSVAIKSIGYDEDKEILELQLRDSERVYRYFDVPLDEYLALVEADSVGHHYSTVFKEKFTDYKEVT